MKIVKNKILNENPNAIYLPDKNEHIDWYRLDNVVFSKFDDNKLYSKFSPGMEWGENTHYDLYSAIISSIEDDDKFEKIKPYANVSGRGPGSGRAFPTEKLITFWQFPKDRKEFDDIVKQLNTEHNLGIDNTWKVEIPNENLTRDMEQGWGNWYPDEYSQYFISISQYKGGYERPKEETEIEHEKSPMLKKKRKVPMGIGSNQSKKHRKPLRYRQAMYAESVKENLLNENPNAIIKPDVWEKHKDNYNYTPSQKDVVTYDDNTSFAFGYYGPKGEESLFVSNSPSTTHPTLYKRAAKTLLGDRNSTVKEVQEFVGNERGVNSGRIFPTEKVITFWNFPKDYKELMSVVSDLNKRFGPDIKIDDKWLVEVPSGEFKGALEKSTGSWGSWHPRAGHQQFIPFSEYRGGYKRSEEELKSPHLEKDPVKRKEMLKGYKGGSYKTAWGTSDDIKWRQKKQTSESFYPRLK